MITYRLTHRAAYPRSRATHLVYDRYEWGIQTHQLDLWLRDGVLEDYFGSQLERVLSQEETQDLFADILMEIAL